jgi:NAD(P)-dependent dehydrogenase (short-subunit alcohol dehydrogenase family)
MRMDDYSKIFDLSGRRALVIGGASGIGRASCAGLACFGAKVICGDVEMTKANDAVRASHWRVRPAMPARPRS